MKLMMKIMSAVAVLMLFSAAYAEFDAGSYLRENVVEHKLPNGITVLMIDRGYSPTLALNIYFKAGSVDEDYNTTGAAHMLEHMFFKGSETYGTTDYPEERKLLGRIEAVGETIDYLKVNNPENVKLPHLEKQLQQLQAEHASYVAHSPYDRIYTELGGVGLNASTSKDVTGYYIQLPSVHLERWAEVESDRFKNPVMREYYPERENVIEERMMRYESRGIGGLFERFLAAAFIAHPYRHPVIGWGSVIPVMSLRDVRDFYSKYYIPSKMVITVVGMQDTDKTYEIIKKYFSDIPEGSEPRETPVREPEQRGERRVTYEFDANPYVIMGWHKPAHPHEDNYAFDVIAEILTGGSASLMQKSFIHERGIALSVDTWNGAPGVRYDNMFTVFGAPRAPHDVADLEDAILEKIEDLKQGVDPEDLERAVNRIETDMVFRLSTNSGLAGLIGRNHTVYGDWRYVSDYVKNIRAVTPDSIQAAAEKYLNRDNLTVAVMIRPDGSDVQDKSDKEENYK